MRRSLSDFWQIIIHTSISLSTFCDRILSFHHNTQVLADKGYDSSVLVDMLEKQGCVAVIPSRKTAKSPRNIDMECYKERFLIETFFSKVKHFRRIFSRFDKTTSAFLGFIYFAASLIWIR